jgi:hypothetical protein
LKSIVEDVEDAFICLLLSYGTRECDGKHCDCEEFSLEEEALMDSVLALKEWTSRPKE